MIGMFFLAGIATPEPASSKVLFEERFRRGAYTPGRWGDGGGGPRLVDHSPLIVGGGKGIFWDRSWSGPYSIDGQPGALVIHCLPLSAGDRNFVSRLEANEGAALDAGVKKSMDNATHKCGELTSRQTFPLFGTTFEAAFSPGQAGTWGAFWVYDQGTDPLSPPVGRLVRQRDVRAELDIGEYTINADGTMLLRFVSHYADANKKWLSTPDSGGCSVKVKRQAVAVKAAVTNDGRVTMFLNGSQVCPSFQLPAYTNVPVSLVANMTVRDGDPVASYDMTWFYIRVRRTPAS